MAVLDRKAACVYAAMIADYFLAVYLLQIRRRILCCSAFLFPLLLLLLGNVVFVVYDYALFGLVVMYCRRIRDKLHKYLK